MACGKWLMTTLVLLSLATPCRLAAQAGDSGTSDTAVAEISSEALQKFAKLQAELDLLQAEYRERLGTTHQDDAKRDIQVEMHRSVAEVLERHGVTDDEYQMTLFAISSDVERLELFETLVEEAARTAPEP